MSKQEWLRHRDAILAQASISPLEVPVAAAFIRGHRVGCKDCARRAATQRANRTRRERDAAYRSLGLTKTPYGWE